MSTLLHIGSGPRRPEQRIPKQFLDYDELRMDIDASAEPDIVGDITAIDLPTESMDAVYASHLLEHLEPWQVQTALDECWRVLRLDGEAVFIVPDLAAWAQAIVADPAAIETVGATAYQAPVSILDALFGYAPDIEAGKEAMRHRTAFTRQTLARHLHAARFSGRVVAQDFQICAVVRKGEQHAKEGQ
jgi:SAM-dependent methyltransferase